MNIIHGDCLEELKKLEDNSVDAVVCDPPYGLSNTKPAQVADVLKAWVTGDTVSVPAKRGGFMGADWDSFVPPPAVWEECMRVLKPGGHMAVFAGARTQDLMGLSIRLAGFEIRDTLGWIYGSGMPKSLDVSKAIDKKRDDYPAIREVVMFIREAVAASTVDRSRLDEALGGSAVMAHFLAPSRSNAGCPKWDQWQTLKSILHFGDDMDAEVWRLNGRKGTPGEAWEKREVTGVYEQPNGVNEWAGNYMGTKKAGIKERRDIPASDAAKKWSGWGTALKPAIEPIILARKPLDGTVAANVLAHGVGGLNIDACRVGIDDGERDVIDNRSGASANNKSVTCYGDGLGQRKEEGLFKSHASGRFPANVLLDEHAAKEMDEQSGNVNGVVGMKKVSGGHNFNIGEHTPQKFTKVSERMKDSGGASRFFPVFKSEEETPETKGRFPANVLLDEHAAAEMDEQSGVLKPHGWAAKTRTDQESPSSWSKPAMAGGPHYRDEGGASRYFPVFKYQAKAPKKERPVIEREDGTKIQHSTVKPLALMEWLVSLIVPPNGVVLDPFAGSGTTLQAAINKGFIPIGIEQDADYIKLIEKRLEGLCTTHKN